MQKNHQMHLNKNFQDLNPVVAGEAQLSPGQRVGCTAKGNPFITIHYVVCGSGILRHPSGETSVHAGQMFIFFPNEMGSFTSDAQESCAYRWVGFLGSLSPAFHVLPRVFSVSREMFPYLEDKWDTDGNLEFRLVSDLFFLYAELIQSKKERPDYIQMVKDYVNSYYMTPLTLQSIADHVGLNPHYLSRLFKKHTGISLQSHILSVRLWEAKRYLHLGYSTKETANLCGFNDTSNFSKSFKKVNNISPAAWKKAKDELIATMIRPQ